MITARRLTGIVLLVVAVAISWHAALTPKPDARVVVSTHQVAQPAGQGMRPRRTVSLAAGRLLVASRTLTDPNFAQTVVLLLEHGPEGAAGLIVNAPSGVPVSRVFGHLKLPPQSAATAFIGGPVTPHSALALVRSRTAVNRARLVTRDIHLFTNREPIETRLTAGVDPREFRLYLGHAGWGAGQLEREIALNAWHVFDGDSEVVFDAEPATAWRRQIRRTELLEASMPRAIAAR